MTDPVVAEIQPESPAVEALLNELSVSDLADLRDLVNRGKADRAREEAGVDVDLDTLFGRVPTFRFRGQVYTLPPEMPVSLVTKATELATTYRNLEASGDRRRQNEAAIALYNFLMDLIRSEAGQEDLPDLPIGTNAVIRVMGLLTGDTAGRDVDEAVLEHTRLEPRRAAGEGDDGRPPTMATVKSGPKRRRRGSSRRAKP